MRVPVFHGLSPIDLMRATQEQDCFPFNAPGRAYFYRARNAIYYLFLALVKRRRRLTVLVPDYHSGNEVLAMRAAGASIVYCPVGRDMQMTPDDVEQLCDSHHPDVLYVIHYAGWPQPIAALVELCRRRKMLLVEDCALALLSGIDNRPLGSFGDWSVFCLYKTLPVPNGAVLVQNTEDEEPIGNVELRPASLPSTLGRTAELLAQRARARAGIAGSVIMAVKRSVGWLESALHIARANVGDIGFEIDEANLAMSPLSTRLLQRLDFSSIFRQRVENYRVLSARLGNCVVRPLPDPPDSVCPLFCPVLVPDKPAAVAALRKSGVESLEFWNDSVEAAACEMADAARFLRAHVLELPLHQDLNTRHMDYMAECLRRLDLRMSNASPRTVAA